MYSNKRNEVVVVECTEYFPIHGKSREKMMETSTTNNDNKKTCGHVEAWAENEFMQELKMLL